MGINTVIEKSLAPFNDNITKVTNLGEACSTFLKESQNTILQEPLWQSPLPGNQQEITTEIKNVNLKLNDLTKYTAPTELASSVYNIVNNVSSLDNSISSAINVAEEGINDVKLQIATSNSGLCSSASKLIQGMLSSMAGGITQLQRAGAAIVDALISSVVSVPSGTSSIVIKVLPRMEKAPILNLPPQFASVLGAMSTLSPVISSIPINISDCSSLLESANTILNITPDDTNSIMTQASLNKDIFFRDFNFFIKSYNKYYNTAIQDVNFVVDDWVASAYLKDVIDTNIAMAETTIQNSRDEIEYIKNNTDNTYLLEAMDNLSTSFDNLDVHIENLKTELYPETIDILETLRTESTKTYDDLKNQIETSVNEIQQETDSNFESLLKTLEEVQKTTSIEIVDTSNNCTDNFYRTAIENR